MIYTIEFLNPVSDSTFATMYGEADIDGGGGSDNTNLLLVYFLVAVAVVLLLTWIILTLIKIKY